MDGGTDSRGLLQSVLSIFQTPMQTSTRPASLGSWTREVWLRAGAFLQLEALVGADPESDARILRAFEDLISNDSDQEIDSHSQQPEHELYPKLRRMREKSNRDPNAGLDTVVRASKRRRECDDVIDVLEQESKKRPRPSCEQPTHWSRLNDPDADNAVLMRRYLVSLDNALRSRWVCCCQKCSGFSVILSPPQHKTGLKAEASFEVFFGVRSTPSTELQEAKITVRDLQIKPSRSSFSPATSDQLEPWHICRSIKESLDGRMCLNLALENGIFQRLRPQPRIFGSNRMPRSVPLSALFDRQQELLHGAPVLSLKGKRVLAVVLASALLPFLETPWLQFPLHYSMIHFFEPLQGGLPDITKPFLALEHIPTTPPRDKDTRDISGDLRHIFHPNATVLALGILLFELNYCTPTGLMTKDPDASRSVNDDYYTCMTKLGDLEDNAGIDYRLATEACLRGDYYPAGQEIDFEDVSVQRLFYQNVVKRLEAVILSTFKIELKDLSSFSSQNNESCWGTNGREVIGIHTGNIDSSGANNRTSANPQHSKPNATPAIHASVPSRTMPRIAAQPSTGSQAHRHLAEPSQKSICLFDASNQMGHEQVNPHSEEWMNNLICSISHHVDLATDLAEPVRIAILDSGIDPESPFVIEDRQLDNPRIKEALSFVNGTKLTDVQDEIGHGTHALGLLLKVAPCAEIYVARIARQKTFNSNTCDDITKAINHAVQQWKVDVISMSFGIRDDDVPMNIAISNASNGPTLLFAAASNDGANLSRAFPAACSTVFCIHSTDGHGNPSRFNPTASETDFNFSLLGEQVSSHWPAGVNGHDQTVHVMTGTSVATPIAAGLAASVLSFVRQMDTHVAVESERLGPWLKRDISMGAVFKSMVKGRRGVGYDYITPRALFDEGSTREDVYRRIKDIKRNMYKI